MRRLIAVALVLAVALALVPPAAEARHGTVVVGVGTALGLVLAAPFIIAGSILAPLVHQPPVHAYPAPVVEPPVVYQQPAVYQQPVVYPRPVYAAPSRVSPPASHATTVQYPHGRYELRGDGVHTAYRWVWIPNAPPPPPPADR